MSKWVIVKNWDEVMAVIHSLADWFVEQGGHDIRVHAFGEVLFFARGSAACIASTDFGTFALAHNIFVVLSVCIVCFQIFIEIA